MKLKILIISLITSFLLAACGNNSQSPLNVSGERLSAQINSSNALDSKTQKEKRITYQDYIKKYQETPTSPLVIEQENQQQSELLATYSTSVAGSSDERINNIKIVCDRLNNYILNPEETFSYNSVTGPFGPDDGFEKAPILLKDGSHTDGYGGGVCQLSSTLYNVIKNINNVEITERHHHSSPVSYVPKGEDATVSLQSNLDFKFVNNTSFPIRFEASCEDNKVNVWAYKEI